MNMRRIYEGTALPQMMYACSIWSNANIKGRLYTKKTLRTLQSMQARAASAISGAYKATSRAALDIESFLLPVEQRMWKHNADVVTQLLSSMDIDTTAGFQTSAAQPATAKTSRNHIDSWQKICENMACKRSQGFGTQEQIPCFLTPPWRRGLGTYIDKTAEKARERHDKEHTKEGSLSIYTDSSGIDG
jgi:hypothetical protein